jgi:NAD(P)H dehydrogenase (quinone)
MKKILVTGATGPLGGAVIESLLKKTPSSSIAGLARNVEKAAGLKAKGVEVRVGDYDNYLSLVAAFKGIDKLYFVSGNDVAHRMTQHENVVSAAQEAGVRQVVYTSIPRKDESDASPVYFVTRSHIQTEQLLKSSGLTYTILQHGIYLEMIPVFAGEHLLETKTIYQPSGNGKAAFALRTDLAEGGANVLLDITDRYDNKVLLLTGAEAISYDDAAKSIAKATGLPIIHHSPSLEEFTATLTAAGVPSEIVGLVAGFATAIKAGEFDVISGDLEMLLGRKPATAAQFLATVYNGKN